jgi:transposase
VVSELNGKTARQLTLRLIEGGSVEDAIRLAGNRLKASHDDLRRALEGELSDLHRETLLKVLDQIRFRCGYIRFGSFPSLYAQTYHELLQTIPGLGLTGAALLLVEIGPDLKAFKTPERLASWVVF